MSQERFAQRLGLNRGNVASYEHQSIPPLDVLMDIAEWFNISIDALTTVDLSKNFKLEQGKVNTVNHSPEEIAGRLNELKNFCDLKDDAFAKILKASPDQLENWLCGNEWIDLNEIMMLANHFPWLNMEWLLKGNGPMVGNPAWHAKRQESGECEICQKIE